ncbi:MAG: hypothetical protein H6810_08675 [Phycisphaeraceae bacterium]|nr:MAG: hypothetical protein H6810_08675 [Phycisphaeraceae bacterium]
MTNMRLVVIGGLFAAWSPAHATVSYGPSEYLSAADSPWFAMTGLVLEDFEDGVFNIPGVTASGGTVLAPGGSTDSVDGDDGAIDGSGTAGHSFYRIASDGILFSFNAAMLGRLPTHAGVVWTDGPSGGVIEFEAYDASGGLITRITGTHADSDFHGTTAEDRFYGVEHDAGIASIFITSSGSMEVDHLQYIVPAPQAFGLLAAFGAVGVRRRR